MSTHRARRVPPIVASARPRLRSAVLATGTGFAVLLAGLAVWMGSSPSEPLGSAALRDAATVAAEAEEEAEATVEDDLEPIALPLVAYELFLARDPFEPVVPVPEPAPADPTDPTDPDDPNGNGNGNGSDTNGNDSTSTPSCTRGVEVVCNGRVLTIVEVLEENGAMVAVIQVDTMRWRVTVGDVFADVFQVLSISADEVRVLYGDRIVTILVRDNALK